MNKKDVRWKQRFSNYKKGLAKLTEAIEIVKSSHPDKVQEIIKEGLIQRFEYTHELAWNVMRDFMLWQGNTEIYGSRDATREAFSLGLIEDGHHWMKMIDSRNKTSHTYNEETANEIYEAIIGYYQPLFLQFQDKMEGLLKE